MRREHFVAGTIKALASMHARKRTAERMAQDPEANQMVRDLTERVRSRS